MDPNAALAELRTTARRCLNTDPDDCTISEPDTWTRDAVAALERFAALDDWLSAGGFTPRAWTH